MKNVLFIPEVIADTSPHVGKRMSTWFISFSSPVVYYAKGSESSQSEFLLHKERYFLIWGEAPQDVIPKEGNPGMQEPINTLSRDMILLQI